MRSSRARDCSGGSRSACRSRLSPVGDRRQRASSSSRRCSTASRSRRSIFSSPAASRSFSGSCATSIWRMARSISSAPISAGSSATPPTTGFSLSPRASRHRRWWLAAPGHHLPLHAGPGVAADVGHDRHLDRARRSDAVVVRRRIHSSIRRARSTGRCRCGWCTKYPTYRMVVLGVAIVIGCSVVVPQPHARRHDDPGRRR